MKLRVDVPNERLFARGGASIAKVVDVMIANSVQHAQRGEIVVSATREGDEIIVTVQDGGRAVAKELRETCFTLEGQSALKGRSDGRYGRALGLFASRLYAESLGGRIEADGEDGAAIFRLRLRAA
jgi:K+-sensing histidine kinase KdpD